MKPRRYETAVIVNRLIPTSLPEAEQWMVWSPSNSRQCQDWDRSLSFIVWMTRLLVKPYTMPELKYFTLSIGRVSKHDAQGSEFRVTLKQQKLIICT